MPKAIPIGLIGVGLLGSAIAERLLGRAFRVLGYDHDPWKLEALKAVGGEPADSARQVFETCDRLFLALPTSDVVKSLLLEQQLVPRTGQTVLDATTGAPADAVAIGERLLGLGIRYLDATISGSSDQVRNGDAIVMAGGDATAFEESRDLLDCLARSSYHLGPWGTGSRMKLVSNLVLGLNRAVLAEGLAFARSLGFDLGTTLQVLRDGACYSRVMDTKGAKMITGDYRPQARLSQHLKDVGLILAEAQRTGAAVPLSELHRRLLEFAQAAGYGDCDNSAIMVAFHTGERGPRDRSEPL